MRTQRTAWYDKKNDKVLHGIKVYVIGTGWVNCAQDGEALLFETIEECEAKRKELRRRPAKEFHPAQVQA